MNHKPHVSRRSVALAVAVGVVAVGVVGFPWVVGGASQREVPVLDAAAGGVASEGDCFQTAEYSLALPDAAVIAREIAAAGYDRRLPDGGYAVRADDLARELGGKLIARSGDDKLTVVVDREGAISVETYLRVQSAAEDDVWYLESATQRVACGQRSN